MVRLIRIERSIEWPARALVANRDALPFPTGMLDLIVPQVDIFGSERIQEAQVATVLGTLGAVELSHDAVQAGSCRLYLSLEYSHDDAGVGAPRRIRPGRIIPTSLGFPFASFRDEILTNADELLAVRNFTVGPTQRAAVRVDAINVGARITGTFVWIEFVVGEYVQSIS